MVNTLFDGTGNSDTRVPMWLTCRLTVDYELVRKCQMAGDRPHRGDPLGKMPELWPFDMLKRRVVECARQFQESMRKRGYQPLQTPTAMELWGPYTEKLPQDQEPEWVPEEGNP